MLPATSHIGHWALNVTGDPSDTVTTKTSTHFSILSGAGILPFENGILKRMAKEILRLTNNGFVSAESLNITSGHMFLGYVVAMCYLEVISAILVISFAGCACHVSRLIFLSIMCRELSGKNNNANNICTAFYSLQRTVTHSHLHFA